MLLVGIKYEFDLSINQEFFHYSHRINVNFILIVTMTKSITKKGK